MARRPPLARLFADLNRSHLGGRLPRYRVLRVEQAPLGRAYGFTRIGRYRWVKANGDCNTEPRVIRVRRQEDQSGQRGRRMVVVRRGQLEREILLHEMCHAAKLAATQ